MKSLFIIFFVFLSIFFAASARAQFVPLGQSCDTTHPCSGYPTNRCIDGYCVNFNSVCVPEPQNRACDASHPCCDASGGFPRICDSGYCRDNFPRPSPAPRPLTSPTPIPTIIPASAAPGGPATRQPQLTIGDLIRDSGLPGFKFENAKLGTVLTDLFSIVITLAFFLAFFWLVWGAFQYMSAGGNKEGLAKARARITWAIVGLILITAAFFVAQFAQQIILPKGGTPLI